MDKMKLISVRLYSDTLAQIDLLATAQSYRKRSFIIQQILKNVLTCSDDDTLAKIVDTFGAYDKGYLVSFKIDAEQCKIRNSERY